jgi:hypothetical protein
MVNVYLISDERDTDMLPAQTVLIEEVSRQNDNCQDRFPHSNFENEEPFNKSKPGNSSSTSRNFYVRRADPFLPENRIPLPKLHCKPENNDYEGISSGEGHGNVLIYSLQSPSNGRRRNERERQRVRSVNEGFERLRNHLPVGHLCQDESQCVVTSVSKVSRCQKRRFSKVDVLRGAIAYIRQLEELLKEEVRIY